MEYSCDSCGKKGEVVHHIDRDKRNNAPENLEVFSSQKEHALLHQKEGDAFKTRTPKKGGGAND